MNWVDFSHKSIYGNSLCGASVERRGKIYVYSAYYEDKYNSGFKKTIEEAKETALNVLDELEEEFYNNYEDEDNKKIREEDWN